MPQNIAAAKTTLALLASSSASLVGAATSAVAISEQLNKQQDFLYLSLPIWFFFVGVFVLSAIGAIGAFFTDTLSNDGSKTSLSRRIGNLIVGFISGVIGAFVVLPSFTTHPPMPLLWITALVMSFSGSVLIHNLAKVKQDEELQASVRRLVVRRVTGIVDMLGGKK